MDFCNFFVIFLGPPLCMGGFFRFYGFFGAPGKVAKRVLRFCMVFLGPLVRWQKYFKTFFGMPGYLPDMGFYDFKSFFGACGCDAPTYLNFFGYNMIQYLANCRKNWEGFCASWLC